MWLDSYLDFGEAEFTSGGTDVIDQGERLQEYRNNGPQYKDPYPSLAHPMCVVYECTETGAPTGGGSPTISFRLIMSNSTSSGVITGGTVLYSTINLFVSTYKKGNRYYFYLPKAPNLFSGTRYIGWQFNKTKNAAITAGKFKSYMTLDPPEWAVEFAAPPKTN